MLSGPGCRVLFLEHAAERADQVPQLDFLNRLLVGRECPRRQVAGQPRIALAPFAAALLEHAGRVAILLVLQQPADQLLPRVFQLVRDFLLAGQHHPRLDLDQRAGHVEKVADGVDVDLLQHGDVFEELVGDRRDRNVRRRRARCLRTRYSSRSSGPRKISSSTRKCMKNSYSPEVESNTTNPRPSSRRRNSTACTRTVAIAACQSEAKPSRPATVRDETHCGLRESSGC